MLLEQKIAIITGCNRGIVKTTLEVFAKNGADIFACVRKESDEFTDVMVKLPVKQICYYLSLRFSGSIFQKDN
mgnify:CR=1 FL=1